MARKAGRRGNGEGSIGQRADGTWQARLTLETGERKYVYAKTRAEVAAKLAALVADRNRGLPINTDERLTVERFMRDWLETVKPQLKATTHRRYTDLVTLHMLPTLGRVQLAKLSAQAVQSLYARLLESGLSGTTVHHVHATLHAALAQAERLGLVPRNVSDLVRAPKMSRAEMHVLTLDEARRLQAAAAEHKPRWAAFYVLALHTGMRLGEMLALKWADLDMERGTLQVRHTASWTRERGWELTAPKTAGSKRSIRLDPGVVEVLRQHRTRQLAERLEAGPLWEDHNLIFPNQCGKVQDGMNLLHYTHQPLLKRAGLPQVRLHDLRHTAATLLLQAGTNPKIVSERLGHSTVGITLNLYSHVTPDMQQEAAAKLAAALL